MKGIYFFWAGQSQKFCLTLSCWWELMIWTFLYVTEIRDSTVFDQKDWGCRRSPNIKGGEWYTGGGWFCQASLDGLRRRTSWMEWSWHFWEDSFDTRSWLNMAIFSQHSLISMLSVHHIFFGWAKWCLKRKHLFVPKNGQWDSWDVHR